MPAMAHPNSGVDGDIPCKRSGLFDPVDMMLEPDEVNDGVQLCRSKEAIQFSYSDKMT